MQASWLYSQEPIWIVVVLLGIMTVCAESGCWLGRRLHPRTDDARRGPLSAVPGSPPGLLALLLSFTFAMSAARYDARRQLVVKDENQLTALLLQSNLLPEPTRKAFKRSLGNYVTFRVEVASMTQRELVRQS